MEPMISLPGEGKTFELEPGSWARFKLTTEMTDGKVESFERFVPPHTLGADPHYHHTLTEYLYVISGEATIQSGESIEAYGAGSMVLVPPKVVHGFWNRSDEPMKLMISFVPAFNHDHFFEELKKLKNGPPETYERDLAALRVRFDSVSA